jgi:hypothetical protein
MDRLLIINDQQDFARRIAATAERYSLATRILPHTLDFNFMMRHWRPNIVAVQMAMAGQEDVEVLLSLERVGFPGHLVLTGDVSERSLNEAAKVASDHGLRIASVLARSASQDKLESVIRFLKQLEQAA